jgi:lipoprotein-releasing system permease protein
MGYPIELALRYLGSKKREFISVGTAFAILGVALGVAALATVMSVTGGFQSQFREKVLGVNAHVLVLKYSTDFREYRDVMKQVSTVPGVVGVAPFSINPMMLTHGEATATGVLLKGVDPEASLGVGAPPGVVPVLDLPRHVIKGQLDGLRQPGATPPSRRQLSADPGLVPTGALSGEPERDDAGRPLPLIREIERKIAEDDRRSELLDAGLYDAGAAPARTAEPKIAAPPDAGAPDDPLDAGTSIEPDGGYVSVLPEGDDLPESVDPDDCTDPDLVKKMPGIVVGVSLARTLKLLKKDADGNEELTVGQCLTVTSPTIGFTFSGGQVKPPVAKRFRVIAIFEAGFDQYDSKLVYTDLYEAQAFYDQGDTVTGVEMKVDDIDRASEISEDISKRLASGLYNTMDWEELNHGLFTALKIQQWGMSFVLALIIVVAAFTVIATLIMVVLDKKKEIAVLKAMGATDTAILRIFLYQGGIIGVLGTSIGLLLGLAVCKGLIVYGFPLDPRVYFISHLPVLVRPEEFVITGVIAIVICLTATIVPSLYAARMRPAEGFRDQ